MPLTPPQWSTSTTLLRGPHSPPLRTTTHCTVSKVERAVSYCLLKEEGEEEEEEEEAAVPLAFFSISRARVPASPAQPCPAPFSLSVTKKSHYVTELSWNNKFI